MPLLLSGGSPAVGGARPRVRGPSQRQSAAVFQPASALLTAILVIEFIYAIVGIVWLTQYYTSCNDLTAKNVTLGMSASPGGRRDGMDLEKRKLRHARRESFCKGTRQLGWPPPLWSATYFRGPRTEGAAVGTGLSEAVVEGPSASGGNLQSCLFYVKAGPWPRSWLSEGAAMWSEPGARGSCTLPLGARGSQRGRETPEPLSSGLLSQGGGPRTLPLASYCCPRRDGRLQLGGHPERLHHRPLRL